MKSLLAAAVLGLSGLAAPAGAQDARLVSYEELLDRVARLEEEMAEAPLAPEAPPADENSDDGGYYFVYESVIVTPYFSQNTSYVTSAGVAVAEGHRHGINQFNWDMEYSPRFEVGHIDPCNGTGWRARYWHFDNSTNASITPQVGNAQTGPLDGLSNVDADDPDETLVTKHSLRMSVLDLEFLKRDMSDTGGFTASVGLRYVRMDQELQAAQIDEGELDEGMRFRHNFEGIGPTIAAEYLKRHQCSYWGAFVNARGSLLYGESNIDYRFVNISDTQTSRQFASNINDQDLLSVVEMQIGLDYRRPSCNGCHEIFLRVALEAQYWANAGSASNDLDGNGTANAQETDMGFLGFTIATGLDW